jgi:two-component system cell cycle response regulator
MPARVLVVDDQPLNVKVLEAKLSSEYYDVSTAADGAAAMEMIGEVKPDIVLLDVMMPGLDGFAVCRRIKADPALAHIPVIMVTALSDPGSRVRGLEAGADDFLIKPINDIALFARLRSLLRQKMVLDELRLRDHTNLQLGAIDDTEFAADSGADGRILIVEDSAADAALIEQVLSRENAVSRVTDCDAALRATDAGHFELIVVSLDLDGCDGLRLCSQLRSHDATRHLSLLMLIDQDNTERMAKGLDLGVNDYLYKPIDRNELIARTRSQIRHKRYQDRLRRVHRRSISLAVTDSLTGLYNRRYLTAHLASTVDGLAAEGKPLALAMVDIDHFKAINDSHGHAAGDGVLRDIAELLKRSLRATDMVARLGGEEFVVVMPDTDVGMAEAVTRRLRRVIAEATAAKVPITVSIGVAAMLGPGDTPERLLKRADDALYEAKRGGRNRVIAAVG